MISLMDCWSAGFRFDSRDSSSSEGSLAILDSLKGLRWHEWVRRNFENLTRDARSGGAKGWVYSLDKRYGIFKIIKFAAASGTGFVVAELLITLSVYEMFGRFTAPGDAYSHPAFVAADIAALVIGVAVSFFLNERYTVDTKKVAAGRSLPIRLLGFEGVNGLGNLTILLVQYLLLQAFSLTPVIGNIVGAIVSYPVTYLISMHFVWKSSSSSSRQKTKTKEKTEEVPERLPPPPVAAAAIVVALYLVTHLRERR